MRSERKLFCGSFPRKGEVFAYVRRNQSVKEHPPLRGPSSPPPSGSAELALLSLSQGTPRQSRRAIRRQLFQMSTLIESHREVEIEKSGHFFFMIGN